MEQKRVAPSRYISNSYRSRTDTGSEKQLANGRVYDTKPYRFFEQINHIHNRQAVIPVSRSYRYFLYI